jgi:hypothetical protein
MATTVMQYQVKRERAEENQQLVEAMFAELDQREPEGFTFKVFRLEDGVSFVHVVVEHDDVDHPDSLHAMPLFRPSLALSSTVVTSRRRSAAQSSSAASADPRPRGRAVVRLGKCGESFARRSRLADVRGLPESPPIRGGSTSIWWGEASVGARSRLSRSPVSERPLAGRPTR